MPEGQARLDAPPRTEYRRRPASRLSDRPDRIALWAVAMAVIAMVAAATSAQAGSGGTTRDGGDRCRVVQFGERALEFGDCGADVKTLNWILKGKEFGVPLDKDFRDRTDDSVRAFQRRHDLNTTGVVRDRTRKKIVHSMRRSVATWYGPGFWGETTACGRTLRHRTMGVAHRRLPCGTKVVVGYHGRFVRTHVIDRGPYANGADWDLTEKTARRLNFTYTDRIRVIPVK